MKQKIEVNKEHVPEVNDVKCVNNDDSGNKIVSFENKSETRGFQEIMSRMETSFTHALEKITTQQANLFETKLSSIDKMYSKSLESHNEKFNMLMKKFEEMTTRGVTACKEAEQFKCQLKNVQHVNTLEQEVMKTKYETQISQSKLQGEQKLETIKKLDNEVLKLAANLTEQESKIQVLETQHKALNKQLENKEQEILSLKIHNCRDESGGDFTSVQSTITQPIPSVTIIGTSNTKGIDPQGMSSRYSINKVVAYTLSETESKVRSLTNVPKVLVFHSLTNDIKTCHPDECIFKMETIINVSLELFPDTKIVLSLPTPRADNPTFNNRGLLISALLKEKFNDNKMIAFCDNSNLSYKNEPLKKFLDTRDGVHLNESGIRVFASNLRDCIDNILGLPSRHSYNYGNRHPYDGQRD
ncbi:unnamed protein product [Mytilus edulis]|uniref:SGNH hydrolase-type esterase domain-containing protein n=1 Tax=Mytilus edulis TaxID=6550 RepID=A0A8S3R267_MYTED|nr:unnamed protein product [Mytilus edulis]